MRTLAARFSHFTGLALATLLIVPAVALVAQKAEAMLFYQLYVTDMTLDKTEYVPGDTVTGTFTVMNAMDEDVPDYRHQIAVVGGFIDFVPTDTYGPAIGEPVYLGARQTKTIPFTYTIPQVVGSGELALQVKSIVGEGIELSGFEKLITIKGAKAALTVMGAAISVNGDIFALAEGPTLKENELPLLLIDFKNTSSESITVVPTFSYYEMTVSDKSLATEKATSSVTFRPGESKRVSYMLNTFNRTPRVYVVNIAITDGAGLERAPKIEARYVVAGDMARIQQVRLDTKTAQDGDPLPVYIRLTGSPIDARNIYNSHRTGPVDFSLSLFNEMNQVVATAEKTIDLGEYHDEVMTLTATRAAKAMRAEATISKDGKVLDTYKEDLSEGFKAAANEAGSATQRSKSALTIALITAGIIVVLGGVALIIRRVRASRQQTPTLM